MDTVDVTVFSTILAAAAFTALLAVVALWLVEMFRAGRAPALLPSGPGEVVFLFEDEALVDGTAAARDLLAVAGHEGSPWSRLLQVLSPRFPSLAEDMTRLLDEGRIGLTSTDGGTRLEAEWRQGLARIRLDAFGRPPAAASIDSHSLASLEAELGILRTITDRVPYLTWKEDAGGQVTWANAAYLDAADRAAPGPLRPWPPQALFPPLAEGAQGPVRVAVTLPGDRAGSWFEVMTLGADSGGALRLALPADALVRAETAQKAFVQTLSRTFATLTVGLAIFDRSRRLVLFNPALVDLTGLGPDYLAQLPKLAGFIDTLREARLLPEPKNFGTWRQRLADLEAAAERGTFEESWSLADGRVFRVTGRPHPDGAVAFLIEDVTAEVTLTRRFKSELQLGQAALDAVGEAVAIFAEDGTLALTNAAYDRMWGVDPQQALRRPTLAQSLRDWRSDSPTAPDWAGLSAALAGPALRRPTGFTVERLTGRRMDVRFVPLPGGALLAGFTDAPALAAPLFRHTPGLTGTLG